MQGELDDSTGYSTIRAIRVEHGLASVRQEALAEESAVALVYNGISHAVMMCTPRDLADFALGFSLSEGILLRPSELHDLDIQVQAQGVSVEMQIAEPRFLALKQTRRTLAGRTGCGLCGTDSLASAIRPIAQVDATTTATIADIQAALATLSQYQTINAATGAVHAAGYWQHGKLVVREDVGRHNALDKLIGTMAYTEKDNGVLLMTSRASYEIVHKAASANMAVLVAISAPTTLAARLADEAGITLVGFARESRMTVYTHPHRLRPAPIDTKS